LNLTKESGLITDVAKIPFKAGGLALEGLGGAIIGGGKLGLKSGKLAGKGALKSGKLALNSGKQVGKGVNAAVQGTKKALIDAPIAVGRGAANAVKNDLKIVLDKLNKTKAVSAEPKKFNKDKLIRQLVGGTAVAAPAAGVGYAVKKSIDAEKK